jgi:hypothetical protein
MACTQRVDKLIGEHWRKVRKVSLDYESDYDDIDYTGLVVLDIGASQYTPDFFLDRGAKHVIGVEIDARELLIMKQYNNKYGGVTPVHKLIATEEDLEELIVEHRPDVVKLDCEGCEKVLVFMKPEIFKIPKYYVLEYHEFDRSKSNERKLDMKSIKLLLWRFFTKQGYNTIRCDNVIKDHGIMVAVRSE